MARNRSVWAKTDGKCYYCGDSLTADNRSIDHVQPRSAGGRGRSNNKVPACKRCNSIKGMKTLEEFRWDRRMQLFRELTGVAFSLQQAEYLLRIGVRLDVPPYDFWFEQPEHIAWSEAKKAIAVNQPELAASP